MLNRIQLKVKFIGDTTHYVKSKQVVASNLDSLDHLTQSTVSVKYKLFYKS